MNASKSRLRPAFLALGLLAAGFGLAAAPPAFAQADAAAAAADVPPPQVVLMRVNVDASGHVTSGKVLDPSIVPVVSNAAMEIARKLEFTPAKKNGRATGSETSLLLTIGFEKHGSGFGMSLKRAQNGPSVVETGSWQKPKVNPRENGALVRASADLRADGTVDMETFKIERTDMRSPHSFAQEQFEKTARLALKNTKFMLEKVDGIEIPSRVIVPFRFNGGAMKRKPGDDPDEIADKMKKEPPPSLIATSKIEGIDLPKIDYTAPEKK